MIPHTQTHLIKVIRNDLELNSQNPSRNLVSNDTKNIKWICNFKAKITKKKKKKTLSYDLNLFKKGFGISRFLNNEVRSSN